MSPALYSGLGRGIGDVGQTFGGQGFQEPQSPAAAPYGLSDIWHPGSLAWKFAYRLGAGSPTIAAGVAGGLAGSAATANPLGGLVGGAAGAAIGSGIRTLGPYYAAELRCTPNDQDGAWRRALKSAEISGAFTGASWLAFGMNISGAPLRMFLPKFLPSNPASRMGEVAAQGAKLERHRNAYAEGAIGAAVPLAVNKAINRLASRFGGKGVVGEPEEKLQSSDDLYALAPPADALRVALMLARRGAAGKRRCA